MKIAFVVSEFPVISETFIVNQIIDLIDKGHEVRIFAFRENKEAVKHKKLIDYNLMEKTTFYSETKSFQFKYFQLIKFILQNINNVNISKFYKKFNFFKNQNKSFTIKSFCALKWILVHGKFDVIHAHFGPSGAYIGELMSFGFFSRAKFITSFHGYDLNPSLLLEFKQKYIKLFREVDLMTVNTVYSKGLLEKMTDRTEIEVLPVGLDTHFFKKQEFIKRREFNLLFVGRLIELKGAKKAIEILKLLIHRGKLNIKLNIVGEGEQEKEIRELILKENLSKHVDCLGAQSQEMVKELMENSDVFVMPGIRDKEGRAETQGLVIQEAQAMELPVLISDVGGMKYGVIDGETGFIIKENDLETFADKIEILMNNEVLKKRMGIAGRNFVKKNYDSRLLGVKLVKLYYRLMNF